MAGTSSQNKGKEGEREVCDILNGEIYNLLKELGKPEEECRKAFSVVQRNQNQSAVGGMDLTNTLGLAIEVKRQEALSVGSWWRQCLASAKRNDEVPVLIYRQNRKPWNIRTYGWINLPDGRQVRVEVEMDIASFRVWWREWVRAKLATGELLRT